MVVPFWGAYLVLNYQIIDSGNAVNEEIEEAVKADQLVLLSFTSEESSRQLRWIKPNEFQFEGKMYDIVKKAEDGLVTHYWCFYHQRETMLQDHLSKLISGIMEPCSQPENETLNFFSFLKDLYFQNLNLSDSNDFEKKLATTPYIDNHSSEIITPLSPPPKQLPQNS